MTSTGMLWRGNRLMGVCKNLYNLVTLSTHRGCVKLPKKEVEKKKTVPDVWG